MRLEGRVWIVLDVGVQRIGDRGQGNRLAGFEESTKTGLLGFLVRVNLPKLLKLGNADIIVKWGGGIKGGR